MRDAIGKLGGPPRVCQRLGERGRLVRDVRLDQERQSDDPGLGVRAGVLADFRRDGSSDAMQSSSR